MGIALKSLLAYVLSSFVLKLFTALGIGFLTYSQLGDFVDIALSELTNAAGGVTSDLYQILAIFGFWESLSILSSVFLSIAAIKSLKVFVGVS